MAAIFQRSLDATLRTGALGAMLGATLFAGLFYYYAYPDYTRVGYAPEQPIPFSHQLHVGSLGMDCRYCHTHVEESPHANVPATQTCMNCHNPEKAHIKGTSPLLAPARESWKSGEPIAWKRIHQIPGYAYFNHSVHVARGVACVSCHGQLNEMAVVYHAKPLTMGWCLNCHYHPELNVRPKAEVTNMLWKPEGDKTQLQVGSELKDKLGLNPPNHCGGCHR